MAKAVDPRAWIRFGSYVIHDIIELFAFVGTFRPLARPPILDRICTRQILLKENPYRDPGGSCIYARDGKPVYVPAGLVCPDRSIHSERAPAAAAALIDKYPPAMREELDKLLGDHEHVSREIVELRRVIEEGKQKAALDAVDHIATTLRDHLVREERFFEAAGAGTAFR